MHPHHLSSARLGVMCAAAVLGLTVVPVDSGAQTLRDRRSSTTTPPSQPVVTAAIHPNVFRPFGTITAVNGTEARARPASSGSEVKFNFPGELQGNVKPLQPVWITVDMAKVRFTRFPLTLAETQKTEVGQGSVTKGAFLVKTRDVRVSPGGLITGSTTVKSEDELEGFTGVVWVELRDQDGNPVYHARVLCRGVNLSQSQTESWSHSAPPDSAAKSHRVVIHHGRMGCDRDRWEEALDKLEKAGEVAGTWAEAYVSSQGGGTAAGTPTEPTTSTR